MIELIFAQSQDGYIGQNGTIPWIEPVDLQFFRFMTVGRPVVMGRKTWESLPHNQQPLKHRDNIVLTRKPNYQAKGAKVLNCHFQILANYDDFWVIGGKEIYDLFMPFADTIVRTTLLNRILENGTPAPKIYDAFFERVTTFAPHPIVKIEKFLRRYES